MRRWRYQAALAAVVLAVANGCVAAQNLRFLDPLAVTADGNPADAAIALTTPASPRTIKCDVVIIGGGLGGSAAAMTSALAGHHVCMTEPTHWIGGQMTSQGVSALDENAWTENSGGNAFYLALRRKIREHYRPLLKDEPRSAFNPGNCWVSNLCFEPRVGLRALQEMLQPYEQSKLLSVYLRAAPVKVEKQGNAIESVIFDNFDGKTFWLLTRKCKSHRFTRLSE